VFYRIHIVYKLVFMEVKVVNVRWSCGHQVSRWVSSGYSGFLPHVDHPNANIGANEHD